MLQGVSHEADALYWAAHRGHSLQVSTLLRSGYDPNTMSKAGATPLHAAARGGHTAIMKALIDGGANILSLNTSGQTALHTSCISCKTDAVRLLLVAGIDQTIKDAGGKTAAMYCSDLKHQETLGILNEFQLLSLMAFRDSPAGVGSVSPVLRGLQMGPEHRSIAVLPDLISTSAPTATATSAADRGGTGGGAAETMPLPGKGGEGGRGAGDCGQGSDLSPGQGKNPKIPKLLLAPTRGPPPSLADVHDNMMNLRADVQGIQADMLERIEKLEARFDRLSNLLITFATSKKAAVAGTHSIFESDGEVCGEKVQGVAKAEDRRALQLAVAAGDDKILVSENAAKQDQRHNFDLKWE